MAIRSLSGPPGDRAMLRIAGDTDCQKVNCPEGAREATLGCVGLWPPRNDAVIFSWSFFWWCGPDTPGGVSLHLSLDIPDPPCYHIFNN